ncbi:hypothetical protein I552_1988 [Mycobacterium xenopi 3993]|nr:hypothetical protein I552_1988 [Mycobacterium xenopi 3993]
MGRVERRRIRSRWCGIRARLASRKPPKKKQSWMSPYWDRPTRRRWTRRWRGGRGCSEAATKTVDAAA